MIFHQRSDPAWPPATTSDQARVATDSYQPEATIDLRQHECLPTALMGNPYVPKGAIASLIFMQQHVSRLVRRSVAHLEDNKMAEIAHSRKHSRANLHVRSRPAVYSSPLQQTLPKRTTLSLLVIATLSSSAYGQVTIPSSTTTINLQTLSPGSAVFEAPVGTNVNVGSGSAMIGDNSQNWQLTNRGTITTSSGGNGFALQLGSAAANGVLVNNYGSITATSGPSNAFNAVYLTNGGILNNYAGATISTSSSYGILSSGAPATISNDGSISGVSSAIRLGVGGSVTQSSTGTITGNGSPGILSDAGPLMISNAGSITGGSTAGVFARGTTAGTVTNSGTISGPVGVQISNTSGNGVAITNTGTITGTGGTAVSIAGSNNTLTLGTGSVLNGSATVSSGTNNNLILQGTGNTSSALAGFTDVKSTGSNWAVSGVISGAGSLTQAGSGTTILTGTNTYTGGTNLNAGILNVSTDANLGATTGGLTFNGGTLQTAASISSARAVTLNTSGIIDTQTNNDLFTGVIAGAGALIKQGSGGLYVTADATYAGGTTISAGTLVVGHNGVNNGTTGSIAGDITDNGILAFNRSNTLTYGGG